MPTAPGPVMGDAMAAPPVVATPACGMGAPGMKVEAEAVDGPPVVNGAFAMPPAKIGGIQKRRTSLPKDAPPCDVSARPPIAATSRRLCYPLHRPRVLIHSSPG